MAFQILGASSDISAMPEKELLGSADALVLLSVVAMAAMLMEPGMVISEST